MNKLVKVGKSLTRIVSIRESILREIGVDPEKDLYAEIRPLGEGRILFIVKEVST